MAAQTMFLALVLCVSLVLAEVVPNQYILEIATVNTAYSPENELGTQMSSIATSYATRFNRPGVLVLGAIRQPNQDLVLVNASIAVSALAAPGVKVHPNRVFRKNAYSTYATWGHMVSLFMPVSQHLIHRESIRE